MTIRGYSGVRTIPSGLVIDTSDSCLACSPDDIVVLPFGEQGLVEYKCPCKAAKENLTPEEAAAKYRLLFCSEHQWPTRAQEDTCSFLSGTSLP